jgi:hypothetical protein
MENNKVILRAVSSVWGRKVNRFPFRTMLPVIDGLHRIAYNRITIETLVGVPLPPDGKA